MKSFFHGWLISIGCYVEKLIKHDCPKEGGASKVLAKIPERSSLTRLINKLPTSCRLYLRLRVDVPGLLLSINEV
jgi:hypothetical protein